MKPAIPSSEYEWCGAVERVGGLFARPALLRTSGRPVWVHSIPKVKSRNVKKNAWRPEMDALDDPKASSLNELQLTLGLIRCLIFDEVVESESESERGRSGKTFVDILAHSLSLCVCVCV